jgi:hypothetical protein
VSLTVTVRDDETGETATRTVPDGDYVIVCCPPCYLDGIQSHRSGATHVLTVKERRNAPAPREETTE